MEIILADGSNERSLTPIGEANGADLFAQTVEGLKKRYKQVTPKKFKKTRQGKAGKEFTYVDRRYVEQWLNEHYADRWSFEVVPNSWYSLGDNIHILGTLSVMEKSGTIRKFTCVGAKEAIPSNGHLTVHPYLKSAESDALKRCAAMLGCAADIYAGEAVESSEEVKLGNREDIVWFAKIAPGLADCLPESKIHNLHKQFTALAEGKITKEQIIINYAKAGINLKE